MTPERHRRIVSATVIGPVVLAVLDDAVTADPASRRLIPVTPHMLVGKRIDPWCPTDEPKHNPAAVPRRSRRGHARPRQPSSQGLTGVGRLGDSRDRGPSAGGQLADDHRAGRAQPRDNRRVVYAGQKSRKMVVLTAVGASTV